MGGNLTRSQQYMKDYYKLNKKHIQAQKRRKYRADFEYKKMMREKARVQYRQQKGTDVPAFGEPHIDQANVVDSGGKTYYPISYAAEAAVVSVQTMRRWCNVSIVPDTVKEEGGRRWRWFTSHQLILLEGMRGYNAMNHPERKRAKRKLAKEWNNETSDVEIIDSSED